METPTLIHTSRGCFAPSCNPGMCRTPCTFAGIDAIHSMQLALEFIERVLENLLSRCDGRDRNGGNPCPKHQPAIALNTVTRKHPRSIPTLISTVPGR